MISPLIPQDSIAQSPTKAQFLMSSVHAYRPSLLSSKTLSIPVSHDDNAHHAVPCNPYLVPPTLSKDKLSPSTKKLYGCDPGPIAKKTCRACAVPNRYCVHCHELLPNFLSQIDMLSDVLTESDLLQETVSDVSKNMFHEANNPIDSGYHSLQPMVQAHQDASSNPVSMVPVSTNKVPCPFPKCGTLVALPCNKDKILPPILCKDTSYPDVKFSGQVLPSSSTPRVSGENLTNAGSTPLGKSETFAKSNYPISCSCIMGLIGGKVLPSPIEFPAQSMTVSDPIGIDEYLEDRVCQAPTHVQHTSTHNPAITSLHEPLKCPRLILMAKGQPQ